MQPTTTTRYRYFRQPCGLSRSMPRYLSRSLIFSRNRARSSPICRTLAEASARNRCVVRMRRVCMLMGAYTYRWQRNTVHARSFATRRMCFSAHGRDQRARCSIFSHVSLPSVHGVILCEIRMHFQLVGDRCIADAMWRLTLVRVPERFTTKCCTFGSESTY